MSSAGSLSAPKVAEAALQKTAVARAISNETIAEGIALGSLVAQGSGFSAFARLTRVTS